MAVTMTPLTTATSSCRNTTGNGKIKTANSAHGKDRAEGTTAKSATAKKRKIVDSGNDNDDRSTASAANSVIALSSKKSCISKDATDNKQQNNQTSSTSSPVHVLLTNNSNDSSNAVDGKVAAQSAPDQNSEILRLGNTIRNNRDYLVKRHRAYMELQHCKIPTVEQLDQQKKKKRSATSTTNNNEVDELWHGAKKIERLLIRCVCWTEDKEKLDENQVVAGALKRTTIHRFVGLLQMHCHTVSTRALALAILELTEEADEIDRDDFEEDGAKIQTKVTQEKKKQKKKPAEESVGKKRIKTEYNSDDSESTSESTIVSSDDEDDNNVAEVDADRSPVACMSPKVVREKVKRKAFRLQLFLDAGGLNVLSRWLIEASTPKKQGSVARDKNSKRQKLASETVDEVIPSDTGPILLILIELLKKIPYDLTAINGSKITKPMKKLKKKLIALQDSNGSKDDNREAVSPVSGGCSILAVSEALNATMDTWEAAYTSKGKVKEEDESIETEAVTSSSSATMASKEKELTAGAGGNNSMLLPIDERPATSLADIQAKIKRRVEILKIHDASAANDSAKKPPQPTWLQNTIKIRKKKGIDSHRRQRLAAAAAAAKTPQKVTSNKRNLSAMQEKIRKEHEKERKQNEMRKQDLAEASRQKRLALEQYRKRKHENDKNREERLDKIVTAAATTNNKVRWKDNLTGASKNVNRALLEKVQLFHSGDLPICVGAEYTSEAANK